jgi:hypothetical protein
LDFECCCLRCQPTYTKKAYPYLVNISTSRTPKNCLELALAAAKPSKKPPLYYSALFKPSKGNGPYFADDCMEHAVQRVMTSRVPRWASICRQDRALFVHLDLDDTRVVRPTETVLVRNVLFLFTKVMKAQCGVAVPDNAWLVSSCRRPSKTSVHLSATQCAFKDVSQVRNLVKHYMLFVEEILRAGPPHEFHKQAMAVCSFNPSDGKFKHALDPSIYHHNALLKLPYSAKPGRPVMIPREYNDQKIPTTRIPDSRFLLMSMWHTPQTDAFPLTRLLVCGQVKVRRPIARLPVRHEKITALEKAAMALVEGSVKALSTGSFTIRYMNRDSQDRVRYYVDYDGQHRCAAGGDHDNNNATVYVKGNEVSFNCFSTDCDKWTRLPPLPFSISSAHVREEESDDERMTARYDDDVPPLVPSDDEEDDEEDDAGPRPTLSVREFKIDSKKLVDEFKDGIGGRRLDEARDEDRESRLLHTLLESYMALVQDHWVQINEKKVIYGERRKYTAQIPQRGDMTKAECVVINDEWITRDKQNFVQALSIYQVTMPRFKGQKRKLVYEKKDLTSLWLDWCDRRVCDRLVFQPDPDRVGARDFNMWQPYTIDEKEAKAFAERRGMDAKDVLKAVEPWIEHMHNIIADDNTLSFHYIMNWITWVLVRKTKTGAALLLMADHGAGKSVVAETYSEILGTTHACTLTRADELTGTFNAHLGFKVMVISEECTFGGSKKDQGLLKNMVTAKTINIRPLYHPLLVLESRHNLIVISNMNRHVLPIEATERRYACFYPSDKYSGIQTEEAKAYFDKVMSVPLHLIAYFHYFIWNFPVSWNPRSSIPVTACTADQKIKTMSTATRFLLTMLQTSTHPEWRDMLSKCDIPTMHSRYTQWCDSASINRYGREDLQMFAQTLQKYLLYTRVRTLDGTPSVMKLTSILARQRLYFARAMGLDRFPLLGEKEQDYEKPAKKKQRMAKQSAACPETCSGWHPEFYRMHASGELQGCLKDADGATPFHSPLPGSAAAELAPLFVTADALI